MTQTDHSLRLPPIERAFIGLDAYTETDADWFAGRAAETEHLQALIEDYPFVLLNGYAGVGKTSLIRAGLIPRGRAAGWRCVYLSLRHAEGEDAGQVSRRLLDELVGESSPPGATFTSAFDRLSQRHPNTRLFVALDQFEQLIQNHPIVADDLYRALEGALTHQWPDLRLLIAYRGDAEPDVGPPLQCIFGTAGGPPRFYLRPWSPDAAISFLRSHLKAANVTLADDDVLSTIIEELDASRFTLHASPGLYPFQIQMVGQTLYQAVQHNDGRLTVVVYEELGGVQSILSEYLTRQLERFDVRRPDAEKILVSLTRLGQQTERQLQDSTGLKAELTEDDWSELLGDLSAAHLIRILEDWRGVQQIEIVHELLAGMIERETMHQERELRRLRGALALRAAALEQGPVMMRPEVMAELYQWRARIVPSPTELRLLLYNGLMERGPAWYWLRRVPGAGLRPFLTQAHQSPLPELHRAGGLALAAAATLEDYLTLQALLADDDKLVQQASARAMTALISQMGWDQALMLRYLLDAPDPDVRQSAAEALVDVIVQVGRDVIPDLPNLLRDAQPEIRLIGERTLAQVAAWDDLPFLRLMLQDPNLDVLNAAWGALHQVLLRSRERLSELRALLSDDDPYVQGAAREALTQIIGAMSVEDRAHLAELSQSDDPNVRSAARLQTIALLHGADAISDLRPLLNDWDAQVRHAAGQALAQALAAHGPDALAELRATMNNPDRPVRLAFAQVLTQLLAGQGREAIPELRQMLEDPDPEVRRAARQALEEVLAQVGREAIPDLQAMLEDSNWDVWQAAGLALARVLAELGRPGLRDLRVLLKEGEDPEVRRAGGQALAGVLRDLGRVSLPELHKMLNDQDVSVQCAAGQALAHVLGKSRARGLPDLRLLLQNANPEIQRAASQALSDMAVQMGQEALPLLRDLLTEEHPSVCDAAQAALQRVAGQLGRRLITYLREMLQDRHPTARHAAAATIAALDPVRGLQAWAELVVAYPLDNEIATQALVALDRQLYCPFAEAWASRVGNVQPSAISRQPES